MALLVFLKKELLLLSRDLHALLLLFLMPTLFILIMSLAMQDTFSSHSSVRIPYFLLNDDDGDQGELIASALRDDQHFELVSASDTFEELRRKTQADDAKFLLHIPTEFSAALQSVSTAAGGADGADSTLMVYTAPGTQAPVALLFTSRIRELLGQILVKSMGAPSDAIQGLDNLIRSETASAGSQSLIPNSVQQNVPAWLVFSMFFIAIPISTTLLGEKDRGTLDRLATMGVSRVQFLSSKLLTYVLINLVQVVLMFLVGIWIVPLLGGESLNLGNSPAALVLIALATSFAAVSFALLIANLAKTTEQATIFAGVSNIVLAALGGIMVPRFVMPQTMQNISLVSPHAWGLEGFLDVILRGGSITSVLPEVLGLALFAMVMMLLATRMLMRQ